MTRWSQVPLKTSTSCEVEILHVVCLDAMIQIYIYCQSQRQDDRDSDG
jgi:hypothetical protein